MRPHHAGNLFVYSKWYRWTAAIMLLIAGVLSACITAEVAIRLTAFAKPEFFAYDSRRGWGMSAGATGWQRDEGNAWVRVNRWGYRGPDWSPRKPPGTLRIAVIGDSFTEAPQVAEDDTFVAVAARALAQIRAAEGRHPARVEALNFGVDSYGTAQEMLTLDDVWKFSPDIIVLAFFPGNDFRNNSLALEGDRCRPFYLYRNDHLVLGGPFIGDKWFRFQCFARFESRHSQLLNVLGEARSVIRAHFRHLEQPRPAVKPKPRLLSPGHEAGLNDAIYVPPMTPVWRDAWRITEAEIAMTQQEAVRHHVIFLPVILSVGIQVSPNPAARATFLKGIGGTDIFYPNERLRAFGAEHGFAVLDLAPPMQTYAVDHQVYFHGFPNTHMGLGHWNERGHAFAGRLIAEALEKQLDSPPLIDQVRGCR